MIEADLSVFKDRKHFVPMELVASYWQCLLEPASYDARGIFAPQGTFVSTRVLHGLKKASSYFQSTIPLLFEELKESMNAWIDDFTLHAKTEDKLISHGNTFFTICKKIQLTFVLSKVFLVF